MRNRHFSVKDIALMAVFGCASSLTTLTTAFIPAPLPGLYGIIAIPVSTILTLMVVEMVRKFGAATFTQLVSGALSTLLPGGPPVRWIIIPGWCISGLLIDSILYLADKKPSESKLLTTIIGTVYNVPGDFLLYWSFVTFSVWGAYSFSFFLYGFLTIHMILGGLAGMFTPNVIRKIKPVLGN
jgi:ABC-type thiamin/hydroxymethylpyrimidine transport system permease subunit